MEAKKKIAPKKVVKKECAGKCKPSSEFKDAVKVAFIRKNPDSNLQQVVVMEVDQDTLEVRVVEIIETQQKNKNKAKMKLDITKFKHKIKF